MPLKLYNITEVPLHILQFNTLHGSEETDKHTNTSVLHRTLPVIQLVTFFLRVALKERSWDNLKYWVSSTEDEEYPQHIAKVRGNPKLLALLSWKWNSHTRCHGIAESEVT